VAERIFGRWRTAAFAFGRRERAVSGAAGRGGRGGGGVCAGVLVGPSLPGVRAAGPGVVECVGAEHGVGADGCQRPAFSHRVGSVCDLRVFPHYVGGETASGEGGGPFVSGGLPCRHGLFVCVFHSVGGRYRQLGIGAVARAHRTGPVVLAGAVRIRDEGGIFSVAHLVALRARQCAEPCLRHSIRGGDQDGDLWHRAVQRLVAGAGGGGLGGARAGGGQRVAGNRLRLRPNRLQTPARVLLGGEHRRDPDRAGGGDVG